MIGTKRNGHQVKCIWEVTPGVESAVIWKGGSPFRWCIPKKESGEALKAEKGVSMKPLTMKNVANVADAGRGS